MQVASAISDLGELEYAFPIFLELLKHEDWRIREGVIEEFAAYQKFLLIPILGGIHRHDKNSVVREIAAWAMGERGESAALPYLEQGLYDQNADVRTGALVAIYKIVSLREYEK